MKQTTVEWIEDQLKQVLPINQMNDIVIQDLFKQAKEKEITLLNHHLEQFSEECKGKAKIKEVVDFYGNKIDEVIDNESIDQALNSYLTKNNLR